MDENELNEAAQAEISATVVGQLKDKYDPYLTTAYLRETAVYDRRGAAIKRESTDNRVGRNSMKKKYQAEGLDTESIDKFYVAALAMRSAGVPADKVNPLFNTINAAIGGDVVAADDVPDEE